MSVSDNLINASHLHHTNTKHAVKSTGVQLIDRLDWPVKNKILHAQMLLRYTNTPYVIVHLCWHGWSSRAETHIPCCCCCFFFFFFFFGGWIGVQCRHQLIESHQKGSDEETNIHSWHESFINPSIVPSLSFPHLLLACRPRTRPRKQTALIWRAVGLRFPSAGPELTPRFWALASDRDQIRSCFRDGTHGTNQSGHNKGAFA